MNTPSCSRSTGNTPTPGVNPSVKTSSVMASNFPAAAVDDHFLGPKPKINSMRNTDTPQSWSSWLFTWLEATTDLIIKGGRSLYNALSQLLIGLKRALSSNQISAGATKSIEFQTQWDQLRKTLREKSINTQELKEEMTRLGWSQEDQIKFLKLLAPTQAQKKSQTR